MVSATVIQCASGNASNSTANTTHYWDPIGFITGSDTVEASHQLITRSPGTYTNFFANLTANAIVATPSVTFRFRKNAANGNQIVTFASATAGYGEDTTNSDALIAGDKISIQSVPGATTNTYTFNQTGHHFTATTDTVTRLSTSAIFSTSNASVTRYCQLNGQFSDTATEANTKCRMRKAGTIKNGAVNVPTNGKTGTTTFQTRKGAAANGNVVITFAASATGVHEDTTNNDAVTVGDDWNWSIVYGAGASNIAIDHIACDFVNTSGCGQYITGRSGGVVYTGNTGAAFDPVTGGLKSSTPEANVQTTVRAALTFTELNVNVTANTIAAAGSEFLRLTGANSALTATITASTAALYSDTTHTVAYVAGDKINWQTTPGSATGSMTVTDIIASTTSGAVFNSRGITETTSISDLCHIETFRRSSNTTVAQFAYV